MASGYQSKRFADASGASDATGKADVEYEVRYRFLRGRLELPDFDDVTLVSATPDRVVLSHGASGATGGIIGVERPFDVARYGADVFVDGPLGPVRLTALPRFPDPDAAVAQGSLLAPMPGSVIRIGAAVGDQVTAGQPLIWLEAMKMEHTITAPGAGILAELNVAAGQQVDVGDVLARVENVEQKED
jgi:pyruvate carboxylase subunit A/propionyl-CoA carboxylase alpha chain